VVISLSLRATEDIGHDTKSGEASRSFLVVGIDLPLRRLFVLLDVDRWFGSWLGRWLDRLAVVGQPDLTCLVWV